MTSTVFTNFFRCLVFDLSFFTNADVLTIKKKFCETATGPIDFHWFHEFFQMFFFFTNADVVTIKDDASK